MAEIAPHGHDRTRQCSEGCDNPEGFAAVLQLLGRRTWSHRNDNPEMRPERETGAQERSDAEEDCSNNILVIVH
jgi:hypothetical protein